CERPHRQRLASRRRSGRRAGARGGQRAAAERKVGGASRYVDRVQHAAVVSSHDVSAAPELLALPAKSFCTKKVVVGPGCPSQCPEPRVWSSSSQVRG